MLGKHEIDFLPQLSKEELAENYDIREFHYQVLKNGSVTLPMLHVQIQNWLDSAD